MGLLEGGLLVLAGILVGRFLPSRRRTPKPSKSPEPVCGCEHHHAMHAPETGRCHATVNGKPSHHDRYGITDAWEQLPCPCRRYSGPEPLPTYFAQEVTG